MKLAEVQRLAEELREYQQFRHLLEWLKEERDGAMRESCYAETRDKRDDKAAEARAYDSILKKLQG